MAKKTSRGRKQDRARVAGGQEYEGRLPGAGVSCLHSGRGGVVRGGARHAPTHVNPR
jgi:hypothetical protein